MSGGRRLFLWALVVSLCVTAVVGIAALLGDVRRRRDPRREHRLARLGGARGLAGAADR